MKKALVLILSWILITSYSCNKERCNNPTFVPRAKLMGEYFGNYKLGAYWIYLNRDSTKRDSVWVDNIEIAKGMNQYDCEYATGYGFDIHTEYIFIYEKMKKLTLGYNAGDLYTNVLYMNEDRWLCCAREDSNSFYLPEVNLNTGKRVIFPFVANYQLWQNSFSSILDTVSIIDRIVVAPSIGIVQFFPTNSNDTFSLIKYYIP